MITYFASSLSGFSGRLIGRCFYMNLAIFFILLFSQSANALDLIEIYKLAHENDPAYQSEVYRHEASPEIYKQALSEVLPEVSLDGFYQRSRQEIFDTDIAVYGQDMARYPSKGFNLVLYQPIFEVSSFLRIDQAKEEVSRANLEFKAAGQDLIIRVVEAYLTALEAQDVLMFSKSEEEAVDLHFKLAKERYDNGLAPITDFHDAKARLANVTSVRIKAENSLADALEGLAELIGSRIDSLEGIRSSDVSTDRYYETDNSKTDDSEIEKADTRGTYGKTPFNSLASIEREYNSDTIPLITPLPDNMEEWVSVAKKQNYQVLIKEKDLEVARKEVERKITEHYPTIALVGRLNRDVQGGSLFGGDSDVEKWEGSLQVKIPLFSGFSVSSKVREAKMLLKATEKELERETRSVTRESKAAFLGIKSSIDNIKALKQAMISNQIALEAKKEGFKSGVYPSLAVTDAERDLFLTKQEYAKSQYDYILNSLKLKKAVGLLKEEDISIVNGWLQ